MATTSREKNTSAHRGPLIRDTKRRSRRVAGPKTLTTRGESEGIVFRRFVRALIEARTSARARPFELVVDRLKKATDPGACINIVLDEFATRSGPDGLGLGIDVLSHAGAAVLAAAERFAVVDSRVRAGGAAGGYKRFTVHDDVWYMLLRATASAEAPAHGKLNIICRAIFQHPSASVRAAGVQSLADLGCEHEAERPLSAALLRALMKLKKDPIVSAAARDLLADVEE